MLNRQQVKRIYDRVGAGQDRGAAYEDRAIEDMQAHASLGDARRVFEFGCGTGRIAADLLARSLPPDAAYYALDLSDTMVQLTAATLKPWSRRTLILQGDGSPHVPLADHVVDRVICLYVLDILSPAEMQHVVDEAHRVVVPGGRLCLTSLTHGTTAYGRLRSALWSLVYRLRPQVVGGCRPVQLLDLLSPSWQLEHHAVVMQHGITSEVVVARSR